MFQSDLQVDRLSDALKGKVLDIIISGSIGAVESVRFVRSLRRLGAKVRPWLTEGGAQFVTETALSWASGEEVRIGFSGTKSHLAEGDACIVAPMSASFLARMANGMTDTASSALCSSYLGMGLPVIVVPNMHDSLAAAPAAQTNFDTIKGWDIPVRVLEPRREEGKFKFPQPHVLADQVAHELNSLPITTKPVLVTMGSTRGYIDDVRYISNYSSGALGSLISEELYRQGHKTNVICGGSLVTPSVFTSFTQTLTNGEMSKAAFSAVKESDAAVMVASVLDYVPDERKEGKISSKNESMTVRCQPTPKIIADVNPKTGIKVGFKLETNLDEKRATEIANEYISKYNLSLMVLNALSDVDLERHKAFVFEKVEDKSIVSKGQVHGKRELAIRISQHIHEGLRKH